jgi:DNA replication protein DnaC
MRSLPPGMQNALVDLVREGIRKLFRRLLAGELEWPLYLFGEPGVGKSFAAALLYQRWPQDQRVAWWLMPEFTARIVECRKIGYSLATVNGMQYERTESTWWRLLAQQDLAVFDDVGIAPTDRDGWHSQMCFEVAFQVSDKRAKRPTVYTSNVKPSELKGIYDARIASRMLSGTVLEMVGDDRRAAGRQSIRA